MIQFRAVDILINCHMNYNFYYYCNPTTKKLLNFLTKKKKKLLKRKMFINKNILDKGYNLIIFDTHF